MSFSFLISGTSAVFSVFCAPAHPVILRRSRRILKHPPTTSTMRTVERKTAGHHPLPSPRRPRNVLVKSACLRFRLRRKLQPLPCSSFSPNKPHVALLRAGFAGGTPFFIVRPRLRRGLTHFGARPSPPTNRGILPLGSPGDPRSEREKEMCRWHISARVGSPPQALLT